MQTDAYTVLAGDASAETRIRGSRFLALAIPIRCTTDAMNHLDRLRKEYAGATHYCWALRTGAGDTAVERHCDDGEPTGSAGAPIARALTSADISDLFCVVIRWFGGSKLGVGGLIRAYGGAAAACINSAERAQRVRTIRLKLEFSYPLEARLRALLSRLGGHILETDYNSKAGLIVDLPCSRQAALEEGFRDLTRGQGKTQILERDD